MTEALAPVPPLVLTGGPSPTSQLIVSRQTNRQGQTGGVTNTATGWLAQPALARGLVPPGRAVPGGSFTLIFHLILRAGTVDRTFHIRKGIFTSKESSHPQASCKEARRNCTCLLPSDRGETTRRPSEPGGAGTGTLGLTLGRALQGGRGWGWGTPGWRSSAVSLQRVWHKALHIEGVKSTGGNSRLNCQQVKLSSPTR